MTEQSHSHFGYELRHKWIHWNLSLSLYVCFSPKQQPSSGSLDSTHSICTLYGVNNMCIAVCTSLSQLLYIVLFIYIINRKIYMHLPRNLHREIHLHNIVFDCQTAFDFEASTIWIDYVKWFVSIDVSESQSPCIERSWFFRVNKVINAVRVMLHPPQCMRMHE